MERQYDIVHYNQYHYIRSAQSYRVIAHNQEFGKSAVKFSAAEGRGKARELGEVLDEVLKEGLA